jgi:hypothetical protein
MKRSVVIHGHFYQPPREDPWLGIVERQPTAEPYHDWNARVEAECYRAVVAARIPGREGRIQDVLNTLRFISFNFGPTLLAWMEKEAPRTYRAILEADRWSRREQGGHGNAVAQAYHHTILPLASRREKVTEVRWGVKDFRHRFLRDPAGMWLPETAVDQETLDVLAQEGIAFTVVAPHQVQKAPARGLPGRFRTAGGRSIALFIYDGPLSHDVAFGRLLKDAKAWRNRIEGSLDGREITRADGGPSSPPSPARRSEGESRDTQKREDAFDPRNAPRQLVTIATDGETYGHHHRFGEMALAAVIRGLQAKSEVKMENFARFLSHAPTLEEVALVEPSSWSCVHGVERWRGDCGCKMDPGRETQQQWRSGLREAAEWLAERIHQRFERQALEFLHDPWEARDDYGSVVAGSESIQVFLNRWLGVDTTPERRVRVAELLELERNALRLFTSCGWFFDDLAGIEPRQILRYAGRALDLADPGSDELQNGFLEKLRVARSNEAPPRDGASIFLEDAKPAIPTAARVAAGALLLAREGVDLPIVPGFGFEVEENGNVRVSETTTGRESIFHVEIEGGKTAEYRLAVRDAMDGPAIGGVEARGHTLRTEDLPELFREALETHLLVRVIDRWIGSVDVKSILKDTASLDGLLEQALISAVRALEAADPESLPEQATLERVREIAEVIDQRGSPIPFDVQTDFYRIMETAESRRQSALAVLREPLGFVSP